MLQASAVRPHLEQEDLPLQIQCISLLCKDEGDIPQVAADGADVLQQQWAWPVRVASPDVEAKSMSSGVASRASHALNEVSAC